MADKIPMLDLSAQHDKLREPLEAALYAVMQSNRFVLGPNVEAFEVEAAAYLGAEYAVGCGSGTEALHLALAAAGVGPGDEVITTAYSFIASAEAICYVGATPVFVDIDPQTFNIDVAAVESALTTRTVAVLPVHLFGQPADILALRHVCDAHGLLLIEDCAQSFGADVAGQLTGTFGDYGCFSFFPSKNLGCFGDGGLVTTRCPDAAERLRALRNHGSYEQYRHDMLGFNSRLDELQAAVLRVKLPHVATFNRARREVAGRYQRLLEPLPLQCPVETADGTHVYHQYTLQCAERDRVRTALQAAGIASAIYYPVPLHRQPVFAAQGTPSELEHAEKIAGRCLSLPMFPEMPSAAVERVAEVLRRALS